MTTPTTEHLSDVTAVLMGGAHLLAYRAWLAAHGVELRKVPSDLTFGDLPTFCVTPADPTPEDSKGLQLYPVAENGGPLPAGVKRHEVRARPIGHFRAPRAGEWFLSGALVEAYFAFTDLTTEYQIVELVLPKRTVTEWRPIK